MVAELDTAQPPRSDKPTGKDKPPLRDLDKEQAGRAMAWLWTYMAALFGTARWNDHAPEAVKPMWQDVLADRTGEDLKRGLHKLRAAAPKFPPGAAEFNLLCREFQPGTFVGAAQPPKLPPVAELLENASVSGEARAYLDMCKQVILDGGLTRAQLEALPACVTPGGHVMRPSALPSWSTTPRCRASVGVWARCDSCTREEG